MMVSGRDRARIRLLQHMPLEFIVGDDARAAAEAAQQQEKVRPAVSFDVSVDEVTELDFLAERGVQLDSEANVHVQKTREAATPFIVAARNATLNDAEIAKIVACCGDLLDALLDERVSPEQAWLGWDTLMHVCESLASRSGLRALAINFLRKAVGAALAAQGPDWDSNYDTSSSWGAPAPHVPAAVASLRLYRLNATKATERLVRMAARDTFRPARGMIAANLSSLYGLDNDLLWTLSDAFANDESAGVVAQFCSNTLGRLLHVDRKRAIALLEAIYQRALLGNVEKWKAVLRSCRSLYLWLVVAGEPAADPVFEALLNRRAESHESMRLILFDLRSYMRSEDLIFRASAMRMLSQIVDLFIRDYQEASAWTEGNGNQERGEAIGKNLVELASELYFASNAFSREHDLNRRPSAADLEFFDNLVPILKRLQSIGIPAVVHRLSELLLFFLDARPKEVFPLATALIESGAKGGYQYEAMGATTSTRIIESFMASHREIIESSNANREALVKALNVFAGWPRAVELVYRFHEAFR